MISPKQGSLNRNCMSLSDNHADMYSSDPCSVPTNMNINYARTIDPNEVDVV